ncbi:hypothetical protein BD779DRAFT_1472614 [Infundibulicybe gibba]|nr:hypothetical protein BD779DRAFT_1472614 [Infundibulicybe gibba]
MAKWWLQIQIPPNARPTRSETRRDVANYLAGAKGARSIGMASVDMGEDSNHRPDEIEGTDCETSLRHCWEGIGASLSATKWRSHSARKIGVSLHHWVSCGFWANSNAVKKESSSTRLRVSHEIMAQVALIELSRQQVKGQKRDALFQFASADPTWDQPSSLLLYPNAVVHKVLWLHPPVSETTRIAAEDDTILFSALVLRESFRGVLWLHHKAVHPGAQAWGRGEDRGRAGHQGAALRLRSLRSAHVVLSFLFSPEFARGAALLVIFNYTFKPSNGPIKRSFRSSRSQGRMELSPPPGAKSGSRRRTSSWGLRRGVWIEGRGPGCIGTVAYNHYMMYFNVEIHQRAAIMDYIARVQLVPTSLSNGIKSRLNSVGIAGFGCDFQGSLDGKRFSVADLLASFGTAKTRPLYNLSPPQFVPPGARQNSLLAGTRS